MDAGNTVVVIEHNLISSRWRIGIIDLTRGGEKGGELVAEGTPSSSAAAQLVYGQYPQKYVRQVHQRECVRRQ